MSYVNQPCNFLTSRFLGEAPRWPAGFLSAMAKWKWCHAPSGPRTRVMNSYSAPSIQPQSLDLKLLDSKRAQQIWWVACNALAGDF